MPDFSQTERIIIETLRASTNFIYRNDTYELLEFDKPTTSTGEPKTDIYIQAQKESTQEIFEFKISVKQRNADFLENRISAERALIFFGENWKDIIRELTNSVRANFVNQKLIYKRAQGKIAKGVFTLGWRFDILNKSARNRSGILPNEMLREVLTGENLNQNKRDAFINRVVRDNSGVANFILPNADTIDLSNLNEIMQNIITIDEYISNPSNQVYFACKALNYRSKHTPSPKWDGDRPLCVYIHWFENNGKLCYEFCFDNPLLTKGNIVAQNLQSALNNLNINTTDGIYQTNTSNYSTIVNE